MQEEVENRTLTLVVSGTKFTGRLMKAAITKYLAHRKEKKLQKQKSRETPVIPHGKQTVKQLIGQNQGVSNIEITDPSIKEFEKIARKYGVDYAVKKDRSSSPPKYLIFFKGRDADPGSPAFYSAVLSHRDLRRCVLRRTGHSIGNQIDQHRQAVCHITGQIAAVSTGIGAELLFIQALQIVQGLLGCKSKQAVGISLQSSQVIEVS